MYFQLFPIYGCMVGVNYWNNILDGEENPDEVEHIFQIMFFVIGFSFHYWQEKN
tara:strand:+ start:687 stop:848 length:162 start_codon:yes stop_codon:yes gene_type:complete